MNRPTPKKKRRSIPASAVACSSLSSDEDEDEVARRVLWFISNGAATAIVGTSVGPDETSNDEASNVDVSVFIVFIDNMFRSFSSCYSILYHIFVFMV